MNVPSDQTIRAQTLLAQDTRATVLSFDPGGDADFAALAMLTFDPAAARYTRVYLCQRVLRFPQSQADYAALGDRVVDAYQDIVAQMEADWWARWGHVGPSKRPPLGKVRVLVEKNGVGRAMLDQMRRRGVPVIGVWTSGGQGGQEWRVESETFTVALNELVRTLLLVWGTGRLLFAQFSEQELTVLEQEARDYEHHLTPAGHSTYRAKAGSHDDVLRALAQGVAWCEHGQTEVRTSKVLGV